MAVKFNFVLNNVDAESLIDCLRSEQFRSSDLIVEEMAGENRAEFIQWYKDHSAYVQRLINKVLSGQEKVKDSWGNDCNQPLPPGGVSK